MRGRLTQAQVDKLIITGMHGDGGGLYLQITGPTSRSWIFRYSIRGRARWLGLGSAKHLTLAAARAARDDARTEIRRGADPVATKRLERTASRTEAVARTTFRERAEQYIQAHEGEWRNGKHRLQWRSSLETYVYPLIGAEPAAQVTAAHVVDILRPIWTQKPETARRVRGRIEAILDYAADPDDPQFRNPAAMTEQLRKKLPKLSSGRIRGHHPSLAYSQLPAFMRDLRDRKGSAARCLEFVVLTAARTNEAIGARWDEIDMSAAVWRVPPARMKSAREHRVPLSKGALETLELTAAAGRLEYVFPSWPHEKPLSNMALLALLRRMNRAEITVHGFRSTFKDWALEQTNFANEVSEMALAHVVNDKTEAAYRRGDLLEKRAQLMEAWSQFAQGDAREPS